MVEKESRSIVRDYGLFEDIGQEYFKSIENVA